MCSAERDRWPRAAVAGDERTRDGLATAAAPLFSSLNSRLVLVSSELFTNQPRADLRAPDIVSAIGADTAS